LQIDDRAVNEGSHTIERLLD